MRNLVKGDYSFIRNSLFERLQGMEPGLALITGGNDSGRSSLMNDVANEQNIDVLNLGLALSKELMTVSRNERPLMASRFLSELANSRKPLFLDHIEILFEPQLKLMIIQSLRLPARTRLVIVNWPGGIEGEFVTYANRSHPEFMEARLDNEAVFKIE